MAPFVERAMSRVPSALQVGVKKLFCGPESFTPDLAPIIGEAPELRNYFVAAGLNSIGILTGGGVGRLVADWIVDGKPNMDVTGVNIDRFHNAQSNPAYRSSRVVEVLGRVYKTHYPYKGPQTARGGKRSPIHDRLVEQNAYFKDVSGWEGADWFAPSTGTDRLALKIRQHHFQARNYEFFDYWRQEHHACRQRVVLMDMSFMSKFIVQGRDAGACLNRLSTADVDARNETITYTQWLNEHGTLEADLTVCKLADDKFYVVATDTMHRHVETHAKRNLNPNGDSNVFVSDVTGAFAQLNLQVTIM